MSTTTKKGKGKTALPNTASAVPTVTPAPAAVTAPTTAPKTVIESLSGITKEGEFHGTIRRRIQTTESKVGLIRRLLMTSGQTKDSIYVAAEKMHKGSAESLIATINTVRSDLKRSIGGNVLATGWRTDDKVGIPATEAVARLRTHELGKSAFSDGITIETPAPKVARVRNTKKPETSATESAPAAEVTSVAEVAPATETPPEQA